METKRYWGLFWIAVVLALHAFAVGKVLGSCFFVMMFFWGWVAVHALRGTLESAQAMVITMCVMLFGTVALIVARPHYFEHDFAYYSLALYPAMVSWISAYFYIRHLKAKRRLGPVDAAAPLLRRRQAERRSALPNARYAEPRFTAP